MNQKTLELLLQRRGTARLNTPSPWLILVALLPCLAIVSPAWATTVLGVVPLRGTELPQNAVLWLSVDSEENSTIEIRVTQGGLEATVVTDPVGCCWVATADLPGLQPGTANVVADPEDDQHWSAEYPVSPTIDSNPPAISPPVLDVRPSLSGNGYRVIARVSDFDDDWGVAAVIPEFDSGDKGPSPDDLLDPARRHWEIGQPLLGDEIAEEERNDYFLNAQETACVRLTAVDFAGNRTTSDEACISPNGVSPQTQLIETLERLFCSCMDADGNSLPPSASALALFLPLLLTCRRRWNG